MPYQLEFSSKAKKDLKKLPKSEAIGIKSKIEYYLNTSDPLVYAKPIKDLPPATHRFRVNKWRIKFFVERYIIYVTRVQRRDKAYK